MVGFPGFSSDLTMLNRIIERTLEGGLPLLLMLVALLYLYFTAKGASSDPPPHSWGSFREIPARDPEALEINGQRR